MGPWWWPLLRCVHAVLVCGTVLAGGQRGWSPAPSPAWAPTPEPGASGDPEGSAAALAFLQTGDAQRLARANCSRGVTAGAPGPGPPPALRATLRAAPEALAHTANFLNMLFQTNDIREASVAEDVEWYQALVRSLAEGHPWVRRAVLALDAHPLATKPRLMLQATKGDSEILLQDISAATPSLGNLSWDNEWFNALRSQRTPLLRKRVLSNDLRSMDTPKWQRGDSYVGEPGHVRWSPPFLECRDGRFLPAWAVTLSSAFYGLKPDLSPEFKGVVRVDIELRDVAIDQCASGPGWFTDTHRCDLNSTQESHGFVLGRYLCRCKPGFYGASGAASGAWAGAVGADGGSRLACRPCRQGCATCEDDAPCLIQEDRALRAAVLSCQACCMLAVFLSMLVSYHFRRSKRIRASGVILLETILFGSLLLYFPVFILYFKPSIFRCIVLRWVRMLGFAIVYGTITLKLYRVLKVFLSRTAQRVPYVSSGRVLKMLGLILLLVLWFLAAWTIGMLENVEKNIPLVIRTQTSHGLHFYICGHDRWDYMMVIAEILFLLWGSFLCHATRAVPSAFHEPRYMGIALHNELMISAAFHVVRFVMVPSLHPDWTLLLFFAHTHGTITMTLALLFIPKFLHAGSPLREEIAAEVYEDELDMRRSGSCLNSSIASAWSERSLDPDDIREELKKLYRQLEAHKTRRMAANNPHLPKKRGSRRSLGRSIARRVAELPEVVARRSTPGERVGTPAPRGSSARRLLKAGGASLRARGNGSWRRAAALRKSHSTEGPARDHRRGSPSPGPPGEPAPGRKMTMATASEHSDSESLDAAPLVCKSASAHNLARHGQPPRPRAAPLQKSLSVVAGARDEALLAASRAAREQWHANQHPPTPSPGRPMGQGPPEQAGKPQSPGATDAHPPASSSPAEGTAPLGDGKVQKHVTYAPFKSTSVDGSHVPRRVRVAVRRTPPPPPVRYQSLGQRAAPTRDSMEPAEPPAQEGKPEGTPEGTAEEDVGRTTPSVGKGRLLSAASIPAQVCPWELVQEEILSRKQKATEAAESGTPSDAAATLPSLKPPSQKTSLWALGLAIKAFNRSRGKNILKGKREGEGSIRKKGSGRRERPSLAETSAVSLGGTGQDSAAKSPEWSRQRPGSEPTARPRQEDAAPCQHNNNAGTAWEAAGWGDSGAEGQGDSPALGASDGEKLGEEPSTPQGDVDAGGGPGPPSEVHEIPPSVGHQEEAERPHETPAVAESGEAQLCPSQEAKAPSAEPGKDAPAAVARLIDPREGVAGPAEVLGGDSRSILPPGDHAEAEQPHAKPVTGSPHPPTGVVQGAAAGTPRTEVCPRGAPSIPGGKAALLRQEAIASREDSGVPRGEESLAKALEEGSSQPEPLGPGGSLGAERVPPRSWGTEVSPAAAGRQAEICAGGTPADSSTKIEICPWEESEGEHWGPGRAPGKGGSKGPGRAPGKGGSEGDALSPGEELGMEKPPAKHPELGKAGWEKAGRRAEVCPWESGEGGKSRRAEICPWDVEGAQAEERKQLEKAVKSISTKSRGLLRAQESRSSPGAPTGPWGSTSSEGPPPKPAPQSLALPEVPSGTLASTRAAVCPWEAVGAESCAAQVCPWERGTALSAAEKSETGGISHVKNGISPGETGETVAADKGSSQRGAPHPGEGAEQPSTGLTAQHPALPQAPPKQGGTIESKRANICPWEVEDELLPKREICPWEEAAAPSGKEKPSKDTRGTSKGEDKPGSGGFEDPKAKLAERRGARNFVKLVRKSLECSKAESKKSQSVESTKEGVSPQGSLSTEQPPKKSRAGSPALPKSPSSKSQSGESLKAEVCPWEALELKPTDKAEICPWEVAAAPCAQPQAKQGPGGGSKGEKRITRQAALASPARSLEKGSSEREAVCPWESLGTEQPPEKPRAGSPALPKSPSKKSQSGESLKAEVCPWELESTDKSEICPWEAALPSPSKEKPRQDKGAQVMVSRSPSRGPDVLKKTGDSVSAKEKGSKDRESICPWESTDTGKPSQQPSARSPVLPKSPSSKSHSAESLKAEVCPWELEYTDKSEICPWEAALPSPSKEKPRQDKDAQAMVSRSPSKSPDVLKKTGDSVSAKEKGSKDRESICPRESTDREGTSVWYVTRSTELLKTTAKKVVTVGRMKAGVSPQGSLGTEQPPEKPRAGSPALPKSPSKKSQSAESLKAEVCPWELESTDKSEICPWEAALPSPSKEKPRQDKDAQPTVSRSPSRGPDVLKKTGDSVSAKEKGSKDRESICPWESLSTEQSLDQPSARSPALPKSPSSKSHSAESLKAEVCPWEALELKPTDKAEVCPWEVAAAPCAQPQAKQGPGGGSKGEKRITRQAALASPARSLEKGSSEREAICPWESLGTEQPLEKPRAGSPALPKSPSKKSQSAESLKAEVCPWELESTNKSEICPWEAAAPSPSKEKPRQHKGAQPTVSRSPSRGPDVLKKTGDSVSAKEKGSKDRESICPWESTDTGKPSQQPSARSPVLPKSPSSKSHSAESLKAEVCPWELESTSKSEICPWEAALPSPSKEKPRQDKDAQAMVSRSPSRGPDVLKKTGDSVSAKDKGSKDRESICPWESTDREGTSVWYVTRSTELLKTTAKKVVTVGRMKAGVSPQGSLGTEQPPEKPRAGSPALPKSPSKKSHSAESLKAEVCPWELESTDKSEICPWEAAAPSPSKEKPRQDKDAQAMVSRSPSRGPDVLKKTGDSVSAKEKGSKDRESICPWESTDTGKPSQQPSARSPVLPKSPSSKSQSRESLKAEVCPWELESTDKSEICPWEAALPSPSKEKPRQDKDAQAMVSRSPSRGPDVLKKTGDSVSAKEKGSKDRESICPRESTDREGTSVWYVTRSTELLKTTAKKVVTVGRMKAGVSPQGSLGTEQPPEKPCAGSPALPKSPSKKSHSAESLKAEVCPWELESTDKSEICPWEAAAPSPSKEKPRQDKDAQPMVSRSPSKSPDVLKKIGDSVSAKEKGSKDRESICPWESLGTEQSLDQPSARSPALPKSPSSKPQSGESLKAEVCPWEALELKPTDKAEICPWEVAAALPEEGAALGVVCPPPKQACASKLQKRSSEREAICPWESLGTEEPSLGTAAGTEPCEESDSTVSRKPGRCPWGAAEPSGSGKKSPKAGVHPPRGDRASPSGMAKPELAAGASPVSARALLKKPTGGSDSKAEHKPLCRVLPGSTPSPGATRAEVCPWEAEEALAAPDETRTDTRKTSEVHP